MRYSRLWLVFCLFTSVAAYGAYDASNIVRPLSQLGNKHIGKKIGLKFKKNTFHLLLNKKNIRFDVISGNFKYSKTPGDKLLAQNQKGATLQLNSVWKIISISDTHITLENRIYNNAEGSLVRLTLSKRQLEGYYESLSKTTDWLIMSLFVVLAAVGTQI